MFARFSPKTSSMTSWTDVQSPGENKAAMRTPAVTTGNPIPREAVARRASPGTRSLVLGFVGYIRLIHSWDVAGRTYRFLPSFFEEPSKERI